MKKFYLLVISFCLSNLINAQLVLTSQFVNPCGGDEHNEFIVAKTSTSPVNIADIAFGAYNPEIAVDYNYWWYGTNVINNPYPTFSSATPEVCGASSVLKCFGFRYPSIPADKAIIDNLNGQLNTIAGCNVFLSAPANNIIPAESNVIIFMGAGFEGTSGLCGFNNAATNLNFGNHCSGGSPVQTYYVIYGTGSSSGPNCTVTNTGYFANTGRRVSTLHVFNGGDNTVAANYKTTLQDFTAGAAGAEGNAGIIVPNETGVTYINNQGCVPIPDVIVPIHLEFFTAILKGDNITVKWKSDFEQEVRNFIIEKSTDGHTFTSLITVAPQNVAGSEYLVNDAAIATGMNFYRLKAVNINGTVDYSGIVKINFTKGAPSNWIVYPNPVEQNVKLAYHSISLKRIKLSISDAAGKLMYNNTYRVRPGTNDISIPVSKLSRAMYFIRISDNGSVETGTFIKK